MEALVGLLRMQTTRREFSGVMETHVKQVTPQMMMQARDALTALRPATDAAVMAALASIAHAEATEPSVDLWKWYRGLIMDAPQAQAQIAGGYFARACRYFTELSLALQLSKAALNVLLAAISKAATSLVHLTPMHADYVQLCVLSKCYAAARALLESPLYDIDVDLKLEPADSLTYFYYGGIAWIGMKDLQRAAEMLQFAASAPAATLSAIAAAAYRKYILVSLLLHAKLMPLPRWTSNNISSQLQRTCEVYVELAKRFEALNHAGFREHIAANAALFEADRNRGLVEQVATALQELTALRLTQTYVTMRLADFAQRVGAANAEQAQLLILRMVRHGRIQAKLDLVNQIVSFEQARPADDATAIAMQLMERVQHTNRLAQVLAAANHQYQCAPEYVRKTATGGSLPAGAPTGMSVNEPFFG